MDKNDLVSAMQNYADEFGELTELYDGTLAHSQRLNRVVGDYSAFVTDERNHDAWDELVRCGTPDFVDLVRELRSRSARCASVMEKYRALGLLAGRTASAGYFDNVESGIDREFGSLRPTSASNVLLVGSGAFPMAPLHIARSTGAAVVGIDTDPEAVELGRKVVQVLGPDLDISLEQLTVHELPFAGVATHVIFSSTVEAKYRILDALHPITRSDVVVAMRYGDHLKSLFNYPMADVDRHRWRLHATSTRPEQIFDVSTYLKARTSRRSE